MLSGLVSLEDAIEAPTSSDSGPRWPQLLFEPMLYDDGVVCIDYKGRRASVRGVELALTPFEFKLLSALTAFRGYFLSHDELVKMLRNSEKTTKWHISNLKGKLGDDSSLIENRRAIGYRYMAPGQQDSLDSSDYNDGVIAINTGARQVWAHEKKTMLTPTEFKLLSFFVKNPRPLHLDELLANVLGDPNYDEGAMISYICTLRGKIEKDPGNPVLIVTVGRGMYQYERPAK